MVDTLALYTLENGALTCFAAIASLLCWLLMPHNLIFMGLHFVIAKLYANSLLASLNMRHQLLQIHGGLDDPPRNGVHAYGQFAKGGQEESALRIRNSVTKLDASVDYHNASSPQQPDEVYLGRNGIANGGGISQRRPRPGCEVIQFRPASSYYWNVIARSTKPSSHV
ncbi:hypothetical protein H1R20_g10065, partial [Candolleomyces eurysporus]